MPNTESPRVRIRFLRSEPVPGHKKGSPIAVVASTLNKPSGKVKFAVCTLNPKDRFDRKLAYTILAGRLDNTDKAHEVEVNVVSSYEINKAIMNFLAQHSKTPKRTRLAAERWLDEAANPRKEAASPPPSLH